MPHLHFGSTYWSCRREPEVESKRFPAGARVETEVAIVGGGFTGCVSAYVFARAGIPVALFERGGITQGSTCASTALLMQEPDRGFVELVRRYGHMRARRARRTSRRSLRQLMAALERMDCGLRYQDSVHLARDSATARASDDLLIGRSSISNQQSAIAIADHPIADHPILIVSDDSRSRWWLLGRRRRPFSRGVATVVDRRQACAGTRARRRQYRGGPRPSEPRDSLHAARW